jgi:hypothetical protein
MKFFFLKIHLKEFYNNYDIGTDLVAIKDN